MNLDLDKVVAIELVGLNAQAVNYDGTRSLLFLSEAEELAGSPGPWPSPIPYGIGRRFHAGIRSLSERAGLFVDLGTPNTVTCSPYGDTDTAIPLIVGDDDETRPVNMSGRRARIEGALVLHTTVGGRPEWAFADDTRLIVWPSDGGDPSEVTLANLPYAWRQDLLNRLVSEVAAMLVRSL